MTSNDTLWVAFGVRSVVFKDTMSSFVKLAREIDESSSRDIGQPAVKCQLMVWPSRRTLVTWRGELQSVQGGAEAADHVLALHTMRFG